MFESFNKHPRAVGETYGEHLMAAGQFGLVLVSAGLACVIHAIFPFAFERTASDCVLRLHNSMAARGRIPG